MPFHLVTRGSCWLRLEGKAHPIAMAGGDLVLIPHGLPHDLVDHPATPARQVIQMRYEGFENYMLESQEVENSVTTVLCGTVHFEVGDGPPLVSLLPPFIHIKGHQGALEGGVDATFKLLVTEATSHFPGTDIIRERLTDVLFVQILRTWLEEQPICERGWIGALRDPQVGAALGLIHGAPERPWSVAALAAEVGLARSSFSARFHALVGEPPLQYLKHWRLAKAASMLRDSELTVAEIAAQIGYETEAALSKAFKHRMGLGPRAYRQQNTV
jgi:AraC-like DNA-binding protein